MKRKKKKVRLDRSIPQVCPRCGDNHLILFKQGYPKAWKKYYYQCGFCQFNKNGERFLTRRGARKKWNTLTNIIRIEDEFHESADM